MAVTRMSYILIKKDIYKEPIKRICKEVLESICEKVEEDSLEIAYNDRLICIDYRIKQKRNSNRSYLELIAKDRENANICVLEKIDKVLKTTDKQKFFFLISNYDGISEYYGKRLYPKYAEFERLLREFILVILTKSYGNDWFTETATEEVKKNVKERAKGSKNIIEHMDYNNMELFLFEKHKPDVYEMFENDLSIEKIQLMDVEELKATIEKNRPKSLWEMEFSEYGLAEKWEKDFQEIHTTRNNVAHNKTIDNKEFKSINQTLLRMIRELKEIIVDIENRDFNELTVVNIIGNLARVSSSIFNSEENRKALFSMAQIVRAALRSLQVLMPKPDVSVISALYDSVHSIQKATEGLYESKGAFAKGLVEMSTRYMQGYSNMQMTIKNIVDSLNTTGLVLKEDVINIDSEEKDD